MLKYRGTTHSGRLHRRRPDRSRRPRRAVAQKLASWARSVRYQALFADAGGLTAGNDVTISGIKVGSVSNVGLQGRNALVTFASTDGVPGVGHDSTRATGTLLGERVLTLESTGTTQ